MPRVICTRSADLRMAERSLLGRTGGSLKPSHNQPPAKPKSAPKGFRKLGSVVIGSNIPQHYSRAIGTSLSYDSSAHGTPLFMAGDLLIRGTRCILINIAHMWAHVDLTVLSRVSALSEADSQAPATFYLDDNDAPRKKPG